MRMKIESVHLGGVAVITQEFFEDDRGFFTEEFRADQFGTLGLPQQFLQENHSGSVKNVVRGLHFQWQPPMGKLMRVLRGRAFLVAVDIRRNSPSLGKWFGLEVSERDRKQIWAPAGFARGFCVLSDYAEIQYLCTAIYNSAGEAGIRWNDPQIGIKWPVQNPILSTKDQAAQNLADWLKSDLSGHFTYNQAEDYLHKGEA
jgi:dTDP-4-dehydrorhamnose 3,5-epimerase